MDQPDAKVFEHDMIVLRDYITEWNSIPIKFKDIAEDVGYHSKRYNQEPLMIERIDKEGNDHTFFCATGPRSGLNGVLRVIEMMNEHYEFDPKREKIPFAEITDTGFLFRCCWDTHSLNKKYRKDAYV